MNRWLRRRIPGHTSLAYDLAALQHARRERDEANTRTIAAVWLAVTAWRVAELACQQADEAHTLMRTMIEPGEVERCTKVRLRSKEEAEAFAARVFDGTGERCVPYKCRHCPLQPVSLEKFWHITNADPGRRGKRGKPAPTPGTATAARFAGAGGCVAGTRAKERLMTGPATPITLHLPTPALSC
jgi:hypothetical protein